MGYQLYRTRDFLRNKETGAVDLEKSVEMVRKLVELAEHHGDADLMVDVRETSGMLDPGELVCLALEFAKHKSSFSRKLAVLMPDDEERLANAQLVIGSMGEFGFEFGCFTEFEDAVEWLAEVIDQ